MGKKRKRSLARKKRREQKRDGVKPDETADREDESTKDKAGVGAPQQKSANVSVPIDEEAFKKALLESFAGGLPGATGKSEPDQPRGTAEADSGKGGDAPSRDDTELSEEAVQKMAQEALPQLLTSLAQQFSSTLQNTVTSQVTANLKQAEGSQKPAGKQTPKTAAPGEEPDVVETPAPDEEIDIAESVAKESEEANEGANAEGEQREQEETETESPLEVQEEAEESPLEVQKEAEESPLEVQEEQETEVSDNTEDNRASEALTGEAEKSSNKPATDLGAAFKSAVDRYVVENIPDAERDEEGNVKVDVDGQFLAQHGGQIMASIFGNLAQNLAGGAAKAAAGGKSQDTSSDEEESSAQENPTEPGSADKAAEKPRVSFNFDLNKMVGQLLSVTQKAPAQKTSDDEEEDTTTPGSDSEKTP